MYLLAFSDSFMHKIFVMSRLRTGISENVPVTSEDFAKTPNVAENV